MNRIEALFDRKRQTGEKALIFYVTAGYPTVSATEEAIDALVEGGADLLELGIPFSDPIADGPTIQKASHLALEGGAKVGEILAMAGRVRRKHPQLAMLFFTAYNLVFRMGEQAFIDAAAAAGIDGLLIPDLPPEECPDLQRQAAAAGLSVVFLIAPTTTPARARRITEASTGFVYCISLKGVTGARAELPPELQNQIQALRALTDKPLAVGFGVSRPDQARAIAGFSDGVIVGSQVIKLIGDEANDAERPARLREYARSLREAIDAGAAAE